jgi:hypothetical protein
MPSSRRRDRECLCGYCGLPFVATPESVEESPFCKKCLPDRIAEREADRSCRSGGRRRIRGGQLSAARNARFNAFLIWDSRLIPDIH